MGVPGFFLWLLKRYKQTKNEDTNIIFEKEKIEDEGLLNDIDNIDYLLLDTNCLAHPECFKVLAENSNLTNLVQLEKKMIDSIILYIEYIINYVNPKKGIYIAIDGVAPMAKIKQQRYRRFKSVHDKILFDNIKKKYNKPIDNHWNNSAITPGTEFMEHLHLKLLAWCKAYNDKLPGGKDYNSRLPKNKTKREIYYSSYKTAGEGEHKLLQFIREKQRKGEKYKYVMYGLDADLIFLCLSTNEKDVYLLRESSQIDKKNDCCSLSYVSIDRLRYHIFDTIQDLLKDGVCQVDKKYIDSVINDFIFLCYFLGNDFLPHLPSINIYSNGLDFLIEKYILILSKYKCQKFLIEKKSKKVGINNTFLLDLLGVIANEEDDIVRQNSLVDKRNKKIFNSDPYEIEKMRIDFLMFKIDDPVKLGNGDPEEWRKRYYKHYFELYNGDDKEDENTINLIVEEYLIGLNWVTQYYFDKCPAWDWYFPYEHPPFLKDIYEFMKSKKYNINKINFKLGKPVKAFNQLMLVLPRQSAYLLPKILKDELLNDKSELAYLYPIDYELDFVGKDRYWMASPILPPMNPKLVESVYMKYEKKFSDREIRRNKHTKTFTFSVE